MNDPTAHIPPPSPIRTWLLAGLLLVALVLAGAWWLQAGASPSRPPARATPAATVVGRAGLAPNSAATIPPTAPPEAFVPIVPVVDSAMKDQLRAIYAHGLVRGMRPEVLAKVGDSITVYGSFLTELGCGGANLGAYQDLAPTIAFFGSTELPPTSNYANCNEHNSWTRVGPAARVGWSAVHALRAFATADPATATEGAASQAGIDGAGSTVDASGQISGTGTLGVVDTAMPPQPDMAAAEDAAIAVTTAEVDASGTISATGEITATVRPPPPTPTPPPECQAPDDTPLRCEIKVIRPGVAIVMFGTNDLEAGVPPDTFRANLDRIAGELIAAGVIPILSTIPPRTDRNAANARVSLYNVAIMAVAADRGVPLVNYWRALSGPEMVHHGMDWDGIHPNAVDSGASFTPQGLRYGQNQRNLTLLKTLDKIRRIVYEDGPPEG